MESEREEYVKAKPFIRMTLAFFWLVRYERATVASAYRMADGVLKEMEKGMEHDNV